MAKAKKKVFFPQTRLAELAARSGGMTRDDAVSAAAASMESMRGDADGAIRAAIAALEKIVLDGRTSNHLAANQMSAILKHADQVVTLAGTFGYASLDAAARSLCDLTDGMLRASLQDCAPIAVHVQTLHLLAPGNGSLSPDHAAQMLGELAKVTDYFKFGSLAEAASPDEFIIAVAS
jgi:hypothetical protein